MTGGPRPATLRCTGSALASGSLTPVPEHRSVAVSRPVWPWSVGRCAPGSAALSGQARQVSALRRCPGRGPAPLAESPVCGCCRCCCSWRARPSAPHRHTVLGQRNPPQWQEPDQGSRGGRGREGHRGRTLVRVLVTLVQHLSNWTLKIWALTSVCRSHLNNECPMKGGEGTCSHPPRLFWARHGRRHMDLWKQELTQDAVSWGPCVFKSRVDDRVPYYTASPDSSVSVECHPVAAGGPSLSGCRSPKRRGRGLGEQEAWG